MGAIFNWVYKPAQHGHKVAYLTVATGVLLLLGGFLVYRLARKGDGKRVEVPEDQGQEW